MSGGTLGVAGDILSVAFLCFLCSLAIQLYCAFSRRIIRPPPSPLPSTARSPPPQLPVAACKQFYLSRFQRSTSCPVVSAIAPPPSPPKKLSSAYNVTPVACNSAGSACNVSPLACTVASQAHIADLAKLMQQESKQELEVDMESFICVAPLRQLFTIKEESKDEDATEQSSVQRVKSGEGSSAGCSCTCPAGGELSSQVPALLETEMATLKYGATCVQAPAAGLVSQVSSASSEGGVSLWSSTSPCPSSPAVSYISASSSPFPTSSPPRFSYCAQNSRFSNATN